MEKGNVYGLFGVRRYGVFSRNLVLLLLVSLVIPWQAFADDQLFRETKTNFTPHPFLQPDLSTGNFTYTQPINIPLGRAGIQPEIKLTYNSSVGKQDSIVGYGWSLNIPYIERLNKNGSDKLYNQDLAHTYFYSSLSGELIPIGTTTPILGSFLGTVISSPLLPSFTFSRFAQLEIIPPIESLTQNTTPIVPDAVVSTSTSHDTATSSQTTSQSVVPEVALAQLPFASFEDSLSESIPESRDASDAVQPDGSVTLAPQTELTKNRGLNSKTLFYGLNPNGSQNIHTRFYAHDVHYFDATTNSLKGINSIFSTTSEGFSMSQAQ